MSPIISWTEKPVAEDVPAVVDRPAFERARDIPPRVGDRGDVAVYVARGAYEAVLRHGRSSRLEQGGILLGRAHGIAGEPGRYAVEVLRAIPAGGAASTSISFRFGRETWTGLRAGWRSEAPDLQLVGWYHTHPDLGAFFSGTDRATQRDFFTRPWHVGLVVDPVRDEQAWFAGPHSHPVRFHPVFEEPALATAAAAGLALGAPLAVRRVRRDGRLALANGLAVRLAGVAFPPANARPKPIRRLACQARLALRRAVARGRCRLAGDPPDGAAVHVFLPDGRLLAERLLACGLARLDPATAAPWLARLAAAQRHATWRGIGVWRKKTRFYLDAHRARLLAGAPIP